MGLEGTKGKSKGLIVDLGVVGEDCANMVVISRGLGFRKWKMNARVEMIEMENLSV